MIYKYLSINNIIEKLYRDNGYTEELPLEDIVAWVGEGLDMIGAHQQYLRKVTGHKDNPDLEIVNYKAKLPCDFFKLEQIAVNGEPARYSGYTFHYLLDGACCDVENLNINIQYPSIFIDNWGNEYSSNLGASETGLQGYTFDINNNYITLNVQEGNVCIAYLAIPLDKNGYPLIPDDVNYLAAIRAYITMKMDYIQWRRGKLTADVYKHSEREWHWCIAAAKARGCMPNLDKMESIKNQFMRLIPNISHHDSWFKTMGDSNA